MRQINIFAVFMPAIEVLSSVTTALVIWYGGGRVLSETLSLGALVAFISYMRMFFRPIRDIAEKYNIMQSAMASSERLFLLLDSEDRIGEAKISRRLPGKEGTISFGSVWFSYLEGNWVLKNVSLTVEPGETVAVVGPTGAGKSTLIHLLERFYDPTKGCINFGHVDIRLIPKAFLRARMALITQDVFLFADTIRNNITVGNPRLPQERLEEIIRACTVSYTHLTLPTN